MEKKIYFIEPVFEAKYWGGQALKERYGYTPDLPNIAIAYHVIALPQHHLDNTVRETGEKLSEFYKNHSELFGCNREDFPIRMGSGNKVKQISVQTSIAFHMKGKEANLNVEFLFRVIEIIWQYVDIMRKREKNFVN